MYEPPFRVLLLGDALDRIVECISEDRADVRHMDCPEKLPVRDAGEADLIGPHDGGFSGDQRVENCISGLLFRPEILQLLLELIEPELPLLRVNLRPHAGDLML